MSSRQPFSPFSAHPLETAYLEHTRGLAERGLKRSLPPTVRGPVVDFSHNDYLGLSRHPRVLAAAQRAMQEGGMGSTGSRLLSGNSERIEALEARIAADKGCAAALVFSSGFQANTMVLAALLHRKLHATPPRVLADALIHSSLHQGCMLAGVSVELFRHNDLDHLAQLLAEPQAQARPTFILTETVFGMDGDVLDLARLSALADQYQALLYLDEAHATGVMGEGGYGLAGAWMQAQSSPDLAPHHRGVVMGTFSKALGCMGAYVACSLAVRDYLLHRCTGFVYTTAPSPAVIGAVDQAWQLLAHMGPQRKALLEKAQDLRAHLIKQGWDCGPSSTHIVPLIVGNEHRAMTLKQALLELGYVVSAVRPPTVPVGTSRLRIALATSHTAEQVKGLVLALEAARNSTAQSNT